MLIKTLQVNLYLLCFWATMVNALLPRDKCCNVNKRYEPCAGCNCKITQQSGGDEQWAGSCTNEAGLEIGTFSVSCLGRSCVDSAPVLRMTSSRVVAGFAITTQCIGAATVQNQVYSCPTGVSGKFTPVDCAVNGDYRVTVAQVDPASDNCR